MDKQPNSMSLRKLLVIKMKIYREFRANLDFKNVIPNKAN